MLWLLISKNNNKFFLKKWSHWSIFVDFKLLPSDSANCIWWTQEKKLFSWKALLSDSQSGVYMATGSSLPTAYSPEVVPSSWCPTRSVSHVALHTETPCNKQGFLQPSYCCAKCPLLMEKVLWNACDCKAIENWGSRERLPFLPCTVNFERC